MQIISIHNFNYHTCMRLFPDITTVLMQIYNFATYYCNKSLNNTQITKLLYGSYQYLIQ